MARDPAQRQVGGVGVDAGGAAECGEGGEAVGVSGAGQLGEQPAGRGRGQLPSQAGADHVTGDQQRHAACQGESAVLGIAGRVAAADQPLRGQPSPREVALGVGGAGDPPVLPGEPGLGLQPVQHPGQATPPALPPVGVAGERLGGQPGQDLLGALLGRPGLRTH